MGPSRVESGAELLPEFAGHALSASLEVDAESLRDLIPSAFRRCGFIEPRVDDLTRTATARIERPYNDPLGGEERLLAHLAWRSGPDQPGRSEAAWIVVEDGRKRPSRDGRRLMERLGEVLADWARRRAAGEAADDDAPPRDPTVGPGQVFDGLFTGNLRDYSACATLDELGHLRTGVLPLGRYAFERRPGAVEHGPPLYLGPSRSGAPLEHNGVLICAPQNSGKTKLIVRWAEAANRAGYSLLLVDVKGNLHAKLAGRLRGAVYHLSTDARVEGDRLNPLGGLSVRSPEDTERIQSLVAALLPDRKRDRDRRTDEDDFHSRNRTVWLTALVHILKLRELYYPRRIVDEAGRPRSVDLGDLYELAVDEGLLQSTLGELARGEEALVRHERVLPHCGVGYWAREIVQLLHPDWAPPDLAGSLPRGQRSHEHGFRDYTQSIVQAIEPFSRHGTLHRKVRDTGPGRLFALDDLGRGDEPVTIILAAREQDLEKAETLLALCVARLEHLLFDRMSPSRGPGPLNPVLLLLDETRRIRAFEPNRYITFAREAQAGCVVVYQSLEQIGDEHAVYEVLENVGVQVYLGSLVGKTAQRFIETLPRRSRAAVSEQFSFGAEGRERTITRGRELVELLTPNELYQLPAGEWPALVYLNDQPRRRLVLVDMDESLPQPDPPAGGRDRE